MHKSVTLDSMSKLIHGSYQDTIARLRDSVTESLGADTSIFSVFPTYVICTEANGEFTKYGHDGNKLTGKMDLNIAMLDDIDEAIVVNEAARRAIEGLTVGDDIVFRDTLTTIFEALDPSHVQASQTLDERINDELTALHEWYRVYSEKDATLRKTLYGSLKTLKERELRPRAKASQSVMESEIGRDDVLFSINRVKLRLTELESTLGGISSKLKDNVTSDINIGSFAESVMNSIVRCRRLLEQKVRLDGAVSPVSDLSNVYDRMAARTNQLDFCVKFVERLNDNL